MKKLSVILASLVLFAGVSFASPVKQDQGKEKKAATKEKTTAKKEKKVAAKEKTTAKKEKAAK